MYASTHTEIQNKNDYTNTKSISELQKINWCFVKYENGILL